jgi:hypothetical protein
MKSFLSTYHPSCIHGNVIDHKRKLAWFFFKIKISLKPIQNGGLLTYWLIFKLKFGSMQWIRMGGHKTPNIIKLGCKKYFCSVTYWAPVGTLLRGYFRRSFLRWHYIGVPISLLIGMLLMARSKIQHKCAYLVKSVFSCLLLTDYSNLIN